ncbi:MAG: hypothetical protein L6R42_008375 [Xanthoria sp. 1 TBL-2021]|nr:MAG: hypothetical protein L6R42_008375 [Xanthoria sp. 1 TBL-2021]
MSSFDGSPLLERSLGQNPFDATASGKLTASDPSGKTGGPTLVFSQSVHFGKTAQHGPFNPFAPFGRPTLLNKLAFNSDIESLRAKIVTLESMIAFGAGERRFEDHESRFEGQEHGIGRESWQIFNSGREQTLDELIQEAQRPVFKSSIISPDARVEENPASLSAQLAEGTEQFYQRNAEIGRKLELEVDNIGSARPADPKEALQIEP